MANQQGPAIEHGKLFNVMQQPGGDGGLGEKGCMYADG